MRTISIANQKGGCGKTTTAVNLAAALAHNGLRVLIIDLDPQGHSTLAFGHNPDILEQTIYDVLVHPSIPISRVVLEASSELLDLVPSNILLAGAEIKLATRPDKEKVLHNRLQSVQDEYDICIIDCPPSVGMLTLNALVASNELIVPVQVHYYALEGLKQLLETANVIRKQFDCCRVRVAGLLLTFVERDSRYARQVEDQMRGFFGKLVFDSVIHRESILAEAPSAGQSVMTYAPESAGALDYQSLAKEICYV